MKTFGQFSPFEWIEPCPLPLLSKKNAIRDLEGKYYKWKYARNVLKKIFSNLPELINFFLQKKPTYLNRFPIDPSSYLSCTGNYYILIKKCLSFYHLKK